MIRTFLFVSALSLCVGAVSVPSAMAESGKGWFGFFNRSKTESASGATKPVHMTPGVVGSSGASETTPVNLGRKERPADAISPSVLAAEERNRQMIDEWAARESAATKARVDASIRETQAQLALAEKQGREAQAQKIAQIQKNAAAGIASVQGQPQPQVLQSRPQTYINPVVVAPVASPVSPEETNPAVAPQPTRERKPRQFFNRTE